MATEREVLVLVRELNDILDEFESTYSLIGGGGKDYYLFDNKRCCYYTKIGRNLDQMYNYLMGQIEAKR